MVTKRCLPWMFSINTNMSNEQGQEKSDSEEQCFVSEAIWCSEHSWSLRRISLSWRWWIVASYRKGTVEISNRKESGGGGGGCLCAHHFIPLFQEVMELVMLLMAWGTAQTLLPPGSSGCFSGMEWNYPFSTGGEVHNLFPLPLPHYSISRPR